MGHYVTRTFTLTDQVVLEVTWEFHFSSKD